MSIRNPSHHLGEPQNTHNSSLVVAACSAPLAPSRCHRVFAEVGPDPILERNVLLARRGVTKPAGGRTEQLLTDGIAPVHEVLNGHIIPGAQPAVAVSHEQHLACLIRTVRGAHVPDSPIKKNGGAGRCWYFDGAFRFPGSGFTGRSSSHNRWGCQFLSLATEMPGAAEPQAEVDLKKGR